MRCEQQATLGENAMKSTVRVSTLTTLAVLIALTLVSVTPVFAQAVTSFTGSSLADINIRVAPGVNATSIGILPAGNKVTAIGRNVGNNWIQIQFGTTTGWVAAWLTVYSGDTVLLAVVSDENPPPAESDQNGPFIVSSPYNVNIRSAPGINSRILAILPFSNQATASARTDASNWVKVKYKSTTGWVARWLVILTADINALPVEGGIAGGPTAQPNIPPPQTPGFDSTPFAAPTTLPNGSITVQTPGRVNVRSAPNVTASVLDVISFSDTAVAVGQTAGHNWLQVQHNGATGWVARWVVVSSDDTSKLPVTSNNKDVTPAPGGAVAGQGIYDVFIRSGPNINYGQVAVLPAYTSVQLLARTEESNWVRVDFQGTSGWVAAWVMIATADINNLPVETP